jgi:hypothetical protein
MTVHVGEIHTELSGTGSRSGGTQGGAASPAGPKYPGAPEDEWRSTQARVQALRRRVAAEDFDD